MSNMIKGQVKWFNEAKGFGFITQQTAAKTYSYTSLLSVIKASRPLKARTYSSLSRTVRKVHLRLTLPLSNWRLPLIEKPAAAGFYACNSAVRKKPASLRAKVPCYFFIYERFWGNA